MDVQRRWTIHLQGGTHLAGDSLEVDIEAPPARLPGSPASGVFASFGVFASVLAAGGPPPGRERN